MLWPILYYICETYSNTLPAFCDANKYNCAAVHYKTSHLGSESSKDLDQPGHQPDLISLHCQHEENNPLIAIQ